SDEQLKNIKLLLEFLLAPEQQLETSREIKTFPTRKELYDREELLTDPILVNSKRQIELGTPMPIITEMRAIWDAIRPVYQAVLSGTISPERGAEQMQKNALIKINELKQDVGSKTWGILIQLLLTIAVLI